MTPPGRPKVEYRSAQREGGHHTRQPLAITVAYAAPGVEGIVTLTLPAGSTVAQAVAASGLCTRFGLARDTIAYAIHGQRANGDTPLRDGDRVELTRSLLVDPKQVRRVRAEDKPIPKAPPRKKRRGK